MQIAKDQLLEFLRAEGRDDVVARAEQELPETVDTDRDAALLGGLGVDGSDLVDRLTGTEGGDLPGGVDNARGT